MYCLDDNLNVIRGAHAAVRGCPGDIATFVAQNPALFHATGYAHHPYALLTPPSVRSKLADWVSMGDLRALSRELTRIYQRYGQKTQSKRGVPLYLTEYGYQTRPDPVTRVPFSQAGRVDQPGRVHRLPQPERARGQPVPARRRRPDRRARRTHASPTARSRAGCSC